MADEFIRIQEPSNSKNKQLYTMMTENVLTDVTIDTGETTLQAHKVVLASQSGYMR